MPLEADLVLYNRYKIIKLLGQGGFGEVYQAWDMRLEACCAVKRNLLAAPEVRRQFEQEARMLHNLVHPNLPRVHDYFTGLEDEQYLVMDFVEGEDLRDRLKRSGAVPVEQALAWLEQVCDALIYLHTSEPPVVHRDIKPANIIITPKGKAMLVDFGIAKADPQMRTLSGARAWTPGFAPPEQYGQERTDAQSDVYSLAATAYALLTGEFPPDAMDVAAGNKKPARPAHEVNPTVPLHVSRAIARAMQFNREQRTRSAEEFRNALRRRTKRTLEKPTGSEAEETILELRDESWQEITPQRLVTQPLDKGQLQPEKEAAPGQPSPSGPAFSTQPQDIRKKVAWWRFAGALLMAIALLFIGWYILGRRGQPASACTGTGQTWTSPIDGMTLVCVPAGEFSMGSETGDGDEKLVHTVYLDAFWIDQTEVTNAMFARFVAETGYQNAGSSGGGDSTHPVTGVDWNNAAAYCEWAQRQLPNEAQWEKAARGTDGRIYPWGNQDPDCTLANSYNNAIGKNCVGSTTPIGSYPYGASPYGALDMAGNVWEWVDDWYQSDYYADSPERNPTGPTSGEDRVLRGGSWNYHWSSLRTSNRRGNNPDLRHDNFGFRCAVLPGNR
jgi:formylglycine-generating enzyme required for sulfatase activity/predicted Ser/Thr protein kinase